MMLQRILVLVFSSTLVYAQPVAPVVVNFDRSGDLVCTNLEPDTTATVRWALSVTGPYTNTSSELQIIVGADGMIRPHLPVSGAPRFYRILGVPRNPSPNNLVWINPGTFTMGSPDTEPVHQSDESPQTQVTITYGFWMAKYEVTQGQYLALRGNNPSSFPGDLNRPVEKVSWYDANAYCTILTQQEQQAGRLRSGYVYRLPTEAEWEYACRAGTNTAFAYGNALRSGMANFNGPYEYPPCGNNNFYCENLAGIYLERTTAVGSYLPNAWGLYDMHGNVWEWCHDYHSPLPGGSVINPVGAATGLHRIIRGGSWHDYAAYCRSSERSSTSPENIYYNLGFRVVLAPSLQ